MPFSEEPAPGSPPPAEAVLNSLPLPVLTIGPDERILRVNHAAELFFDASARLMLRGRLRDIIPFSSPIIALVAEVRRRRSSVSEYRVELVQPRSAGIFTPPSQTWSPSVKA